MRVKADTSQDPSGALIVGVVSVSWTAIHSATHTTQITLGNGPFQ